MKIKLLIFSLLVSVLSWGQTPYSMSSGNKTWDLVGTWTVSGGTYTGTDAGNWASVGVIGTGSSVTTGIRTTKSSATIVTTTTGGFQKPSGTIQFLSTGSSATPEAVAVDLLLDFTGRTAGTMSFDWATIDNASGTRPTSLRVFWSIDGTTFTEITGAQLLDKESGAAPTSGTISAIALPTQFSGSSTARLRFYNHAGVVTGGGNRDKMQIDNISISSTPQAITNVSVPTLSGFGYIEGSGPSGEQTFAASGSNLTANLALTAPSNYEISLTSGAGFGSSLSLIPVTGTVSATIIYVRLKAGLTANSYNAETISVTSAGVAAKTVTCDGTVVRPTITLTPTSLTGFAYFLGFGPSGEQTFTVSGVNLSADIVLTAPSNYEISLASGAGFGSSINLVPTAGNVSGTTIYVRLIAGLSVNAYNGESITATSTDAVNKTVTCDGSVLGNLLVINSVLTASSVYGSVYTYAITVSGAAATSYSATGLPAGLSLDTTTGTISGIPTVGVGLYNIDITATNSNGSDTETLALTITAKNLTITGLNANDKVYDRILTATLSGTPSLVGVVGADDVSVSGTPSPAFGSVGVGTVKLVTVTGYTLSGAQMSNYTVSQPTGLSADITPRPLTVSGAVANNKVYNGTTAATITGAALVGVIAPDVVNITPSGTFATANVGTAIVVTSTSSISGADSSNYSLTQPPSLAADITQASQAITFGALVNQYSGAANFTLMATASSGLTITYVSSNPAVATVSGNTVTVVGIGTTIITASQAGDGNYVAAASVNQNQVVITAPCLSDSFTSATFPPAGWLTTSVSRSTAAVDYNTAPASASFVSVNCSLTTSVVSNPTQLRFYLGRSTNTTAKTFTIEISTTSQTTGFSTIATYDHSNIPVSSYNQYTVDLSAYTIYSNVWIRFVKTSATTAPWRFDDLEVFCGTVWNGSAWSSGTPTLASVAVINGDYNTTTDGDIHASSLTVNPTFTVTVTPNHYVTIENDLTVNGVLNIQNNGSLVQINDSGINTGNINLERTASVDRFDYVYWSTPVAPFVSSDISPTTSNTIYKWLPTTGGVNGFGNWASGNETMEVGRGYIERGLNNSPLGSNVDFTATFTGVPNNGVQTMAISRGNYDLVADYDTAVSPTYATKDDDNWNLVGNPYPSSISAEQFLQDNADIAGFVKIWRHGITPLQSAPDPFYNNYGYNYDSNDYLTYNKTGASAGSVSDYFIGAGQGFFVLMNHAAATPSTVVFNNNMRKETYRNDMFYRVANNSQNSKNEKGRIWLDISSSSASVRTLVGYVDGATNEKERGYDAITDLKANMNIYSLIGFEGQIIQGRQLPFNENDQVALGVKVSQNGNYTIAVAEVDGFFTNAEQNIYLEDKVLNTIHDLRSSPYSFTANTGIYNNRFVLRYTNQTLGNDNFLAIENGVKIYTSNNGINMNSELENIKHYEIYNVLGQILAAKKNVNTNESVESSILKNNQTLIVKVTLDNGQTVTKKIVF